MTKINELQPRTGKVELTGTVTKVEESRTFEKFGKSGTVANAKIKDDTGEVTLTLWNEQVEQVKEGDVVVIHNGWVSEYRGELQLSTGKFGSLEVNPEGVEAPAAGAAPADAPTEAEPAAEAEEPEQKVLDQPPDEDVTQEDVQ
jgi:replication factor A1